MRIFHSLSFGLISLYLLESSHFTFCQADEGVCEVSDEANQNYCQNKNGSPLHIDDVEYELVQSLITSLQRREGGFFDSDKIEMRRQIPGDLSSKLGIFAKDDIPLDEVLLKFPAESLIRIEPTGWFEEDICLLKDKLVEELHKGEDSEFKDYIDFLLLQPTTIPAAWSNNGQFLMNRMLLDRTGGVERALPPSDMTSFYGIDCFDDDEEEIEAEDLLYLTLMNGYDTLMAPVYDIINHSNHPDKISVKNSSVRRKQGFEVSASRFIHKGEELLHSYNQCVDCDPDVDVFGTPEIFRNHGFIEDYPQRFEVIGGDFNEEDAAFEIVQKNDTLAVEWIKEPLFNGGRIPSMRRQLQRLDQFKNEQLIPSRSSLPQMEWNLLNQYLETLSVALSVALSDAEKDKFDETYDLDFDTKEEYMLPEDTNAIYKLDKFRDGIYQSETLIWAVEHFKRIDFLESNYQSIEYLKEPKTKDTCLFIDGVFQMCGSYWPYYHEMQVHKAAKYIREDIKRVLFVGAGDNGLLNEIVKYPSLELVVGLELDQHVSRMAFKHLAAKPHFDNPKVQWWFGDASKTLFMLPRDYFGSFDMVLVDLSDTVLSLTVSRELDVVGALSLLLRPRGVFAMNELFFRRVSDVFKHTIYYQFTNVPKVLDQGFVFASNDIDLLNQDLTDHSIKDVHVEDSLLKTDHRFRHVHDYRQNPNCSSKQICTDSNDQEAEQTWQETSPGIFMAIEAEKLESSNLGSRVLVQSTIESALTKAGFHVIESTNDHMTDNVVVTVMEEGYITVRLHEEEKYAAFDTLLWSSFDEHETLKKILVESVGGTIKETSSFRIVTGGMFGSKTWKEDRKSHGPEVVNQCPKVAEQRFVKPANNFAIALDGSINLVQEKEKFHVAVLCAADDLPCESINLLSKHLRVSSVVTFHACPQTASSKDDKVCSNASATKTIDTILSLPSFKKIRAIVVDPNCPPAMEKVPLIMNEKDAFESNVLAMATISSRNDLWRRQLVDKIRRKVVPMDPVFRSHVIFNSTSDEFSSSMELAITSSGDELFIEHLKETVAAMQDKSGFDLHVSNILGGQWRQETRWVFPDEEASKLFFPEDYDHSSAMDQYLSQRPMGVQAVAQLHNLAPLEMNEEVEYTLYMEKDEAFNSNVKAINNDGSYVVFDLFGEDLALPRFRLTSVIGDRVFNLTASDVNKLFTDVFVGENNDNPMYTRTFQGIGEGAVYVAIWEYGEAILLWDGRHTVNINIHCDKLETYQIIQNRIQGEVPSLKIHLLDIHPRGYGHVVNFATDLEDLPTPHWFDDVETG